MVRRWILAGLVLTCALACSQSEGGAAATAGSGDVAKGKQIYALNCTACHNADPTQPGSIGPELAGASRELIEARLLHTAYPPGYTPKRNTVAMPAMPYLAPVIPDLSAYLGSFGRKSGS